MLAVYASDIDPKDPLSGLEIGDRPEPEVPDGWTTVTVKAASLNHHDLWSLRGVGLPADRLPMILGCDAAGLDEDGNEVVVHSVIASDDWRGDETFDPRRSLLSERYQGTFAERVAVPRRNVVPKPAELTLRGGRLPADGVADRLPDAVHARQGRARPDDPRAGRERRRGHRAHGPGQRRGDPRVGHRALRGASREQALKLGADQAFESGARLPERVDAVMETTGQATWGHSIRSLKPGGTLVVCGATTGDASPAELTRIFFLQLSVVGSTMGTREELDRLMRLCVDRDIRPAIHSTMALKDARQGFEAMLAGDVVGKIVFTV